MAVPVCDIAAKSDRRQQQSVRLGEYFRQKGPTFDAVLTGTLRRQLQTYAGPQAWPALP